MRNGYPLPMDSPDLAESPVTSPLPLPLWRMESEKNADFPITGLMPFSELTKVIAEENNSDK